MDSAVYFSAIGPAYVSFLLVGALSAIGLQPLSVCDGANGESIAVSAESGGGFLFGAGGAGAEEWQAAG